MGSQPGFKPQALLHQPGATSHPGAPTTELRCNIIQLSSTILSFTALDLATGRRTLTLLRHALYVQYLSHTLISYAAPYLAATPHTD